MVKIPLAELGYAGLNSGVKDRDKRERGSR